MVAVNMDDSRKIVVVALHYRINHLLKPVNLESKYKILTLWLQKINTINKFAEH